LNGAAATFPITLSAMGNVLTLPIAGTGIKSPYLILGSVASGYLSFTGLGYLQSSADAKWTWLNNAASAGVGFDFATDAVLKIRTRAQSAYATVDALGYSVGGVAGASKGAGPVTSITVVNGIVTACT
jgi:hypothetical protein